LTSFEILAGNEWMPVVTAPVQLDSLEIGGRQLFLGSRILPPGHYERVRLTVAKGSIRRVDGHYEEVSINPASVELALSSPVLLGKDDSRLLFLNWDVQSSLEGEKSLRPALTLGSPVRQLPVDLIYVSCPEIDLSSWCAATKTGLSIPLV
jgi:hypothetical protein